MKRRKLALKARAILSDCWVEITGMAIIVLLGPLGFFYSDHLGFFVIGIGGGWGLGGIVAGAVAARSSLEWRQAE